MQAAVASAAAPSRSVQNTAAPSRASASAPAPPMPPPAPTTSATLPATRPMPPSCHAVLAFLPLVRHGAEDIEELIGLALYAEDERAKSVCAAAVLDCAGVRDRFLIQPRKRWNG